ncbi:glycosyltransferase [Actinomarinicola tropica]|uniref:4,4'-diaponeurosporenoate glycosyltransferase n=1 Tax=Actinomarinicola tropica TaxID=2789776 RepID=A0A5Q2RPG1_9ACTN|nr:glycosyltransferase family 2 protein [Actinomarinicola tropica]QGG95997.1 glycosyltransferase [Actinomarinicola tropica]
MSRELRGSVVVPAWNEAAVIARTLDALFDGIEPDDVEVVVACNGCDDGTEDVVRGTGHPVHLLELGPVGKVGAIRAAEAATTALPRIYLDADTELPGPSAVAVLDALASGAVAARPPVTHDDAGSTWPVRAFYAVRRAMPSLRRELFGAGVYGLSAEARGRFGTFPDVVADDLFAARVVELDEVTVVDGVAPVVVRVPRDTRSLVRTLARVYRGNAELAATHSDRAHPSTTRTAREVLVLGRDPRWWPRLAAYVVLVVAGRVLGRRASGGSWERDHSARVEGVAT